MICIKIIKYLIIFTGQSVIKTLDLKIGQCMLIPKIDMIMGNVRLLFTKCFTAQMEGSLNLTKLLSLQEGLFKVLPLK